MAYALRGQEERLVVNSKWRREQLLAAIVVFSMLTPLLRREGLCQGRWSLDSSNGFYTHAGFWALTIGNKIYVDGGDSYVGFDSLQIFNPTARTWKTIPSALLQGAYEAEGTACEVNGKIYAFGGLTISYNDSVYPSNTVFEFDTATNVWKPLLTTGSFSPREGLSSCVVNGKIYAIGGDNQFDGNFTYLSTVEVFDPSTNTWSTPVTTGSLVPRSEFTSSVVNGKIYVIGGIAIGASSDPPPQVFDPAADTWDLFSSNGFSDRFFQTASVVNDKIYVMGGSLQSSLAALDDTLQVYDPSADTWSTLTTIGMMTPRTMLASAVVNNKIYALGGYYDNSSRNTVEVFDPNGSSSVRSNEFSSKHSLFPNPTPGLVTIRGAAGSVVVTNVLGEEVAESGVREPGSGEVELDLSKLPAGTYFARIETAGGVVMRKIIKE